MEWIDKRGLEVSYPKITYSLGKHTTKTKEILVKGY
jgi:hypothetical protein